MNPTVAPRPAEPGAPAGRGRSRSRRLRDRVAIVWLAAAVVISVVHRWVPSATWLMIHLVLLGALTHSAMVWSEHFAHTLLRSLPDDAGRRRQDQRIGLLGVGSLLVFVGVPTQWWWVVLAGATLVAGAVVWHAVHLVAVMRRALPNRFRIVTQTYVAAAICLPVGLGFGVALAFGLPEEWHGRLVVAHMGANLLGWIGLTVTGTLVTFWPTMLRTRMDDRAEVLAREALPIQLIGLTVLLAGAVVGWRPLAISGLLVYGLGVAWWGRALVRPLRAHGLREFAPASVLASLVWAGVGLIWVGWLLATSPTWAGVAEVIPTVAGLFAVGFAAQLLSGALSYLIPSVMGGGPSVVRAGRDWFDRGATVRLIVINGGLLLWLLPVASWVKVTTSSVVLVALAAFIPLLLGGARASGAARRALAAGEPLPAPAERPFFSLNQVIAGVTALVLAVTLGVAADPAASGLPTTQAATAGSGAVAPTGNTTRVEVVAKGMSFIPNSITVPAGDRLVIVLRSDPSNTLEHDLILPTGRTPRIKAGETAELDAGVITADVQGYCSVAGHRQMGMTLDIVAEGAPAGHGAGAAPGAGGATHQMGGTGTGEAIPANPAETLQRTVDPVLPPLTDAREHQITLRVTEVPLEVAPGLWQTRWTFNGAGVGPTLHGRVGDVFEITLVNDGTIGHSIDFHAGALAPDKPMRTIAPGESLVYRFTAERAGIWMYHCSTMPMSTHIAAGMTGAVVIEPDGLDPVDHSYVLVQSEVFLANAATAPDQAREIDSDKVVAEKPDRVVFNGIANQYDLSRFQARVGERVRFWVLDAGPNRASAFHIVGGQFDTVWTEGTYLLRQGKAALGGTDGGSQVLPLQPAQGGFVELSFPEAGNYPVVSHIMVDAERGAHGYVEVAP
ncbi:multicopper oxidase domain-containing protein [Propioniciclava coleopterorum]|uniref:Copper-containing nitrite reductase n=1 Tax=Propioniciclava coleopterorum TaxID=2714937 RepID=A0A6G7Y7W3_9ACTN|nr:multicopper oxidase domain-containing protein [Propioniciclava coleopterorum]QIK72738.1 multicopper oxidase domain-containing protein [Propioniciclava coleopterorum]